MRDLVVAGGGPVGLATALYAAREGLDVVVCEPRGGAVDKACGEGLMPGAVEALRDLGVHPEGRPIRGICYLDHRHRAEAAFRDGPGLGVRRTTLHAALRQAVADAGVDIVREHVHDLEQHHDHVRVDRFTARHLVAADGLHSPIRRRLGLDAPARGVRRYGLRCHVVLPVWTEHVEVHWAPGVEAYVTPVRDDVVGVALLSSHRAPFAQQLATFFPALHDRVADGVLPGVRGAGPLRQRSTRRVAGRVLLVGDASGYVDALTGEGISIGLAQARAAVAAVTSGDPARYERAWRRITWRYRALTAGLLTATRPAAARRIVVPAAAALPRVFSAAVNELARPV